MCIFQNPRWCWSGWMLGHIKTKDKKKEKSEMLEKRLQIFYSCTSFIFRHFIWNLFPSNLLVIVVGLSLFKWINCLLLVADEELFWRGQRAYAKASKQSVVLKISTNNQEIRHTLCITPRRWQTSSERNVYLERTISFVHYKRFNIKGRHVFLLLVTISILLTILSFFHYFTMSFIHLFSFFPFSY